MFTCLCRNYMCGKPEEFISTSAFFDKDAAITYAERNFGIEKIVSKGVVVWERKRLN